MSSVLATAKCTRPMCQGKLQYKWQAKSREGQLRYTVQCTHCAKWFEATNLPGVENAINSN